MEDVKNQLSGKLQAATNILVTVSSNPSVDQLSACLGLSLWLNKIGKHATAVFSGEIPNALEFLQPEATFSKSADSLRDFIIALDKSKADKLRYKVEDKLVKIFITPYRTNLTADDLEFSQGDFNVDVIVALGVTSQADLDTAIVSHGKILHDATVATINLTQDGGLGSINWHDPSASSLSELVYELCKTLQPNQIDAQIATALLTGVVAETDRFSNNKTSPHTMSIAAEMMSAGANQQLIADKLNSAQQQMAADQSKEVADKQSPAEVAAKPDDGTLEIEHDKDSDKSDAEQPETEPENNESNTANGSAEVAESLTDEPEEPTPAPNEPSPPQPNQTEPETELTVPATEQAAPAERTHQRMVIEPPSVNAAFSANTSSDSMAEEPITDPLSLPPVDSSQLYDHAADGQSSDKSDDEKVEPTGQPESPTTQPPAGPSPSAPPSQADNQDAQTLTEIEEAVGSPHLASIRDQVEDAYANVPSLTGGQTSSQAAESGIPLPKPVDGNNNPLSFNPDKFEIDNHDEEESIDDANAAPKVPPPLVPPDFLPPSPPTPQ